MLAPMLATLADAPLVDPALVYEPKYDGIRIIADVAAQEGIEESGYRVTTNHGPDALQSVFHLHWHVMGGTTLSESM